MAGRDIVAAMDLALMFLAGGCTGAAVVLWSQRLAAWRRWRRAGAELRRMADEHPPTN
jgi:hypothetical protein